MDDTEDLGLFNFEEIAGICKRHIGSTGRAYDEDQLVQVVRWIEGVRIGEILLKMVLDGDVDVVFNENSNEVMFALGEAGIKRLNGLASMDHLNKEDRVSLKSMINFDRPGDK
jgi:hypothetical protein